jgi:hypothetical protein
MRWVRPLTATGFAVVLIASALPFATSLSLSTGQPVTGFQAGFLGLSIVTSARDPAAWLFFGLFDLPLLVAVVGLYFQLNRRLGTVVGFACAVIGCIALFGAVLVYQPSSNTWQFGFYLAALGFFTSLVSSAVGLLAVPPGDKAQQEPPAPVVQAVDRGIAHTGGMRTIGELSGQELIWTQPARTKQAFELRAGDEVVGRLVFERSSLATGAAGAARWTFKREGFWHPQVTVRTTGSDVNAAVFKPSWGGGGTLELAPDRQVSFGSANFWHSQWDWRSADGKPLVHFKSHQGLLKMEGQVDIETDAASFPDLPLLVVLGWYLLILFARDAAAAGAAGAVAATAG